MLRMKVKDEKKMLKKSGVVGPLNVGASVNTGRRGVPDCEVRPRTQMMNKHVKF
jgi:hypothetical protein